jgi:hypothetical protein
VAHHVHEALMDQFTLCQLHGWRVSEKPTTEEWKAAHIMSPKP